MKADQHMYVLLQVWDIRRLERDVSFASRLTYAGQSGRITSVCPVLDGASVASASSSGSLHVWRVEYSSKPGGWAPDKYRGEWGLVFNA
jgi:phosphoinositide-3-kinase regulatory subunit 4